MAAIEKVCELTGEYVGWEMYGYKHNQLQITPASRKQFRGDGDTVYVERKGQRLVSKNGSSTCYDKNQMVNYEPPFTSEKEYLDYLKWIGWRLVNNYSFVYFTKTPSLQGNVNGYYYNWTMDIATMRRKMKRLLRCKKLNVVFVDNLDDLGNNQGN